MKEIGWKNSKGESRLFSSDGKFILEKNGGSIIINNPQIKYSKEIPFGDGKDDYINLNKIPTEISKKIRQWFSDRDAEYHCPECGSGIDDWSAAGPWKKFECNVCDYVAFVGSENKNRDQVFAGESLDERRSASIETISWISCTDGNDDDVKPPLGLTTKIGYR